MNYKFGNQNFMKKRRLRRNEIIKLNYLGEVFKMPKMSKVKFFEKSSELQEEIVIVPELQDNPDYRRNGKFCKEVEKIKTETELLKFMTDNNISVEFEPMYIVIREFNAKQHFEVIMAATSASEDGKSQKIDMTLLQLITIVKGCVEPKFSDTDVEQLKVRSAKSAEIIYTRLSKLSGVESKNEQSNISLTVQS